MSRAHAGKRYPQQTDPQLTRISYVTNSMNSGWIYRLPANPRASCLRRSPSWSSSPAEKAGAEVEPPAAMSHKQSPPPAMRAPAPAVPSWPRVDDAATGSAPNEWGGMNGRSQGALRSPERRCPRDLNGVLAHERERGERPNEWWRGWLDGAVLDR
jgi:hypothetical protein